MTDDDRGPPPEGWAAFFTENGELMLRVAGRTAGHDARGGSSAEDIVSEALTKLIAAGIPKGANARAYAITVVINAALDEIKKTKRFTDEDIDFDDKIGIDDIEVAVDDALLAEDLRNMLGELPEREAHAIREKVMSGRHWRDVAPELGVTTVQGVGRIVNRGLEKLQKMLRFPEPSSGVSVTASPSTTGRPSEATR